jgi:hypothetical protein
MKYFMLPGIALLLCACEPTVKADPVPQINTAEIENPADTDSVEHLIELSFEDIWSDLDTARIRTHHTEDFILLENGVVWNNDSIVNYLVGEQKRMIEGQYRRENRFDFVRSVQRGNTIWVAYQNNGTWIKGPDTLFRAHWLESAIAVKEKGQWKLQQLHSTRVAQ